jgi:hypothetical protein
MENAKQNSYSWFLTECGGTVIQSFLELLRPRLPDSLDHMLAFAYLAIEWLLKRQIYVIVRYDLVWREFDVIRLRKSRLPWGALHPRAAKPRNPSGCVVFNSSSPEWRQDLPMRWTISYTSTLIRQE